MIAETIQRARKVEMRRIHDELERSDHDLVRTIENLIAALTAKGIIEKSDIVSHVYTTIEKRRNLRGRLTRLIQESSK